MLDTTHHRRGTRLCVLLRAALNCAEHSRMKYRMYSGDLTLSVQTKGTWTYYRLVEHRGWTWNDRPLELSRAPLGEGESSSLSGGGRDRGPARDDLAHMSLRDQYEYVVSGRQPGSLQLTDDGLAVFLRTSTLIRPAEQIKRQGLVGLSAHDAVHVQIAQVLRYWGRRSCTSTWTSPLTPSPKCLR